MMKPRRQAPLSEQIVEILQSHFTNGTYPPGSQLPSEAELAEAYSVSRATIRSALAQLAADGAVKRRHGVGTFVSKSTQIANPLNEVIDYYDLIIEQGFEFGFQHLEAQIIQPQPDIAVALKIDPDGSVFEVHKAFTADGDLLIYTTNIIPEWVYHGRISNEEIVKPDTTEPLFFEFLANRCQQPVDYYIATVRPEIAQNIHFVGDLAPVDPLLPVLVIEEVGYNAQEKPILYEVECLFGHRMKFELVRRLRTHTR